MIRTATHCRQPTVDEQIQAEGNEADLLVARGRQLCPLSHSV